MPGPLLAGDRDLSSPKEPQGVKVEVEVDTLGQIEDALAAGVDAVLGDTPAADRTPVSV